MHGYLPAALGKPGHLLGIQSTDFYLKLEDWTWVVEEQVLGPERTGRVGRAVQSLLCPPALKPFISASQQ